MQMPFVAGKCANQRLYFERSCEFSYFLENINIVCVIIWSKESQYLSLHFNGHFSRWTFVSRCLLKQMMMEVWWLLEL